MLVLKRKEGQWVEITHTSGDVLRVRVYDIDGTFPGRLNLAFDDSARNFIIQRPERILRPSAPLAGRVRPASETPPPAA